MQNNVNMRKNIFSLSDFIIFGCCFSESPPNNPWYNTMSVNTTEYRFTKRSIDVNDLNTVRLIIFMDISELREKLNRYVGNVLVHGPAHCGKKSLVYETFPNVITVSSNDLSSLHNTIDNSVFLICNIDVVGAHKQKEIVGLLDKLWSCRFIFTSRSYNIQYSLLSRLTTFRYVIQRRKMQASCDELCRLHNIHTFDASDIHSYHDLLIRLELQRIGKKLPYEEKIETLCKCLKTNTHTQLRVQIYEIILCCIEHTKIYKLLLHNLLSLYPQHSLYIARICAQYQHRSVQGNKQVYHYEAFLFTLKKHLLQDG